MALNFPSTTGQPTDGSFTYTAGGITWIWDGLSWRSGISSGGESDPVYSSSAASNVTNQKIQNWDAAFSWGDHSQAGYGSGSGGGSMNELVDDTTPQLGGVLDCNGFAIDFGSNVITDSDVGNYDTAYGWGDHSTAGYLTSLPAIAIGSLSDVTISTPSTGQVLKYNGSAWINDTAPAGLSNIVDSAQGVNVTGKIATSGGMDIDVGGQITAAGCSVDFGSATISFSGANIGGLTGTIKDVTIITWTLTANGSTDYVFSGDGFPTSQNDPDLYLVRGETYRFVNNTGGHPFRIQSTTSTSGGGTKYDNGVQNSDGTVNDAGNGVTLTFVVPMDAPDTLYYQCTSHPDMFGTINVLSVGSSSSGSSGSTGTLTVATSNAAREYNYQDLPGTATAYGLNTAANVAPQNTPTYTNTDGFTSPISNPPDHPDPVSLAFDGRTDTYTVVTSSIDGGVVELVFTNPIAVGYMSKLVLGFDGNIECGFNGGNYVTASGATGSVTELTVSSTSGQTLNKLTFRTPTASTAVGNLYYVIASFAGSQSRLRIKETDISVGSSGTGDNQLIMHDSSVVIHLTPSEVNKVVAVKTNIPRQIILPAGSLMTPGDTVTVIDVGHGPLDRNDTTEYPFAINSGFPYYTYNSGNSSYAPILIYPDRDDGIQGTNIQPWNSGNSITAYGTAQNGGRYVPEPFHGMPFAINKNGGSIRLMWIGPSYGWRVLP